MNQTKAYIQHRRITMRDTDAAGLIYFGRIFEIAHDAFEAYLTDIGFDIAHMLEQSPRFVLPIVHAEADYASPIRLGNMLTIEVSVDEVRTRSFRIGYRILVDERVAAHVKTIHAAVLVGESKGAPLPPDLAERLRQDLTDPA